MNLNVTMKVNNVQNPQRKWKTDDDIFILYSGSNKSKLKQINPRMKRQKGKVTKLNNKRERQPR